MADTSQPTYIFPAANTGPRFQVQNGMLMENPSAPTAPGAAGSTSSFSGAAGGAAGGASIGLAIGQAIGSMYSAWKGGKTTDYVMKKQAEISEQNRQMAQMSAESAFRQGEAQAAQMTYKSGQIKAKQRTAMAANGVKVGVGSSAEVLASTDIMKEIDKSTIQMNALQAAWGYRQQALQASAQGGIYSGMGSYMKSAGMAQGFSSMLEKGTMAASRWYRYYGGGSNVMGYGDY